MAALLLAALLAQDPAPGKEEIFGLEAFFVATDFDDDLGIDADAGGLLDLNFRWRKNGRTRFGFSLGVGLWDAETTGATNLDVDVYQYRAGFGAEFPFSVMEIGLAGTLGMYDFKSDFDDDRSPFFEIEFSVGWRPVPQLKIGGMLMITHTQSSFGTSGTHLYTNFSGGLGVEFTF
jgi:hypothetical protein